MNTKELLNLSIEDIEKMKRSELVKVVNQLNSTANKRIKRLSTTDLGKESFAYKSAERRLKNRANVKFSSAGKNLNQLRNEYKNVSEFLKMKTSSVSGWKKEVGKINTRLNIKDKDFDYKKFFENYRKLEELDPVAIRGYGSTEVQKMLYQQMVENNDDIMETMQDILEEEYREKEKYYNDEFQFDDIDDDLF